MKINQIKSGILLSYLSIIITILVSIIYTPILLRLLGQSEYGLYQLTTSLVSYLSLLSLGFGSSYLRYYSIYKSDENKLASLNGLFILVYCISAILSLVIGWFFVNNINTVFNASLSVDELSSIALPMILLIISISISFPMSIFSSFLLAKEQFFLMKVLGVLKVILIPVCTLPLLYLNFKTLGIVIVTVSLTLIIEIIYMIYAIRILKFRFNIFNIDLKLLMEISVFSIFIFINIIVDQINMNVDKFLLGLYHGTATVAIYGIGSTINTNFTTLSATVASVFAPRINALVHSKDNSLKPLNDLFIKVGRIQYILISCVLIGFIFFGQYFIYIWAGPEYGDSYIIALMLMIAITIPLTQNLGIEIQRAMNQHKFRSIVYLIIAIINLSISIPLCRMYGGIGSALGTCLSLLLGNILIMNIYYHKKCNINIINYWRNIFSLSKGLIIPIIVGFYLSKPLYDSIFDFIFSGVVFLIIFGISMYYFGFNHYEKSLLTSLFKKLAKGQK